MLVCEDLTRKGHTRALLGVNEIAVKAAKFTHLARRRSKGQFERRDREFEAAHHFDRKYKSDESCAHHSALSLSLSHSLAICCFIVAPSSLARPAGENIVAQHLLAMIDSWLASGRDTNYRLYCHCYWKCHCCCCFYFNYHRAIFVSARVCESAREKK